LDIVRYLRNQCTDIVLQITTTSAVTHADNDKNNDNSLLRAGSARFRAHQAVVTCYSSWLSDQILNGGHWVAGQVVYMDEVCRASRMSTDTMQTLLEFMYTGRTCR